MSAPYGLLVTWLVCAFGTMHVISILAHLGKQSPFWVSGFAVSLVVPIWSNSPTVAVAGLLALHVAVWSVCAWNPQKTREVAERWAKIIISALVGLNYLVWVVSWTVTDPRRPSGNTLAFSGGASLALLIIALVVDRITEKRKSQKSDKEK